jgi:ParB family chromosome partitioning protein
VTNIPERRAIAAITIGKRHRQELGDLAALAADIADKGLLQAIGITPDNELIFGLRRLVACRDHLSWTDIEVRVLDVRSIVETEHSENSFRQDFTPTEKVAILAAIRRQHGGDRRSIDQVGLGPLDDKSLPNIDKAAAIAGFGSRRTAERARLVVNKGIPALVEAMDKGELDIKNAAHIARLPEKRQQEFIRMSTNQRKDQLFRLERTAQTRKQFTNQSRKITIPWRPKQAGRLLIQNWPIYLIEELIVDLQRRLAELPPRHRPDAIDIAVERHSDGTSPRSDKLH